MKKGMKKLVAVFMIMALTVAAFSACGGETDEEGTTVKIGIIQLMEHPSLNTIRESIVEGLAEDGYTDGENITIDYQQLLEKVEVTNPTYSRILQVTVNDPNPQTAADIANEVASVAESKLKEITGMQAIKIYEEAAVPEKPSSPSLKKNCALGLLAGIVLAMAVITVLYLMDDTIKTEDDIEKYLGMTTLAVLPYNGKKQQRQAKKQKKQRAKQGKQTSRKRKEIETDEFN